jgi:hypothetical protein
MSATAAGDTGEQLRLAEYADPTAFQSRGNIARRGAFSRASRSD